MRKALLGCVVVVGKTGEGVDNNCGGSDSVAAAGVDGSVVVAVGGDDGGGELTGSVGDRGGSVGSGVDGDDGDDGGGVESVGVGGKWSVCGGVGLGAAVEVEEDEGGPTSGVFLTCRRTQWCVFN